MTSWQTWRQHFERNATRPLPALASGSAGLDPAQAKRLAWSLARFQIGEVGEGRIVKQIYQVALRGIDDDYRRALGLFIREEGRHARILADMVRALGGRLIGRTWTKDLFVLARRRIGVRFKLIVLFAAEVIGIGFYGLLAGALPPSALREALAQICEDERAHLRFHRDFFATQATAGWRRALFRLAWAAIAPASAAVVLWDHRRTLRAFGVPIATAARTLAALVAEGAHRPPRASRATPEALSPRLLSNHGLHLGRRDIAARVAHSGPQEIQQEHGAKFS